MNLYKTQKGDIMILSEEDWGVYPKDEFDGF
ncbi:hypothetical protein ACQ27_gp261 [Klebsiella phage K64-1]|nr:hypothetical protein ACQ27_gp261 [Klebsiella phage K64-1]